MKKKMTTLQNYRKLIKHQAGNVIQIFCLLCPLLLIVSCGGKLGAINLQDIDPLLSQAEAALSSAREVNAQSLAFETYEQAETELEKAKDAKRNKMGVDAIKYANNAITYAKLASRIAIQNTKDVEANANILTKDAQIGELKKQLMAKDTKIGSLENDIELLQDSESGLKATISNLESDKQDLIDKQKTHNEKVAELNASIDSFQARITQSESNVKNYGVELEKLSRKVDAAETIAKTESRLKRAAVAETEAIKKQMREQAKIFTQKLTESNKQNIAVEHQEFVRRQAEKARAFATQLPSAKTPRTGRTSLSTAQINAGKAALNNWEKTWKSKNMDAHIAFYAPDVTTKHIVVRESKENATTLNRTQFEAKLREMNKHAWTKSDTLSEVERESVIGTYRFSRLISPAEDEDDTALYELWIREVWTHQVAGKWKIYRETWQVYENIPKL